MILSDEYILALLSIKGLGNSKMDRIASLLQSCNASSISWKELYSCLDEWISNKKLPKFSLPGYDEYEILLDKAYRLIHMSEMRGILIVSKYNKDFPEMLNTTVNEDSGKPDIPSIIWYKGDLSITKKPSLAIIGTREPTEKGIRAGEYYAEAFASIGVNIVSGLAVGCDSAGHRGAIKGQGVTTAILANGLDMVYPTENISLADEILSNGGLLLSEYPIGSNVNKYFLVARDRLQAGLANATLVVQTRVTGGTMHAVNATYKSKKPLLVVEFGEDQVENCTGNFLLKEKFGAIGLRAKIEDIKSDPQRFLKLINASVNENESIKKEVVQLTLF